MTLSGAIVQLANSNPAIAASATGGVWHGLAPREVVAPYIRISIVTGQNHKNSGSVYWRKTTYNVSIFAETWEEVETIARAWADLFNKDMAPIDFDEGNHGTVACESLQSLGSYDGSLTLTGKPLCHGVLMMRTLTEHQLA